MSAASRLDLKCFIDGFEIPIVSVNANWAENRPGTAEFQTIPTDAFFNIPPRSLVCIFYLHSDYEIKENHLAKDYKLLFIGEYLSYQFSKASTGRVVSIRCMDFTNYFDFIKQHAVNYKASGLAMTENAFLGVQFDTSSSTSLGKDVQESVTNWMAASKVDGKINPTLGLHRVIRSSFFSNNIFWSESYNRFRIGDTIVGLPNDKSSSTLLNFKSFKKFIKAALSRGGGMLSLRDMVNVLQSPILYNNVGIPCPISRPNDDYAGMTHNQVKDTDLSKGVSERKNKATLNCTVFKPDMWFCPPPACNCFFPDQYTSFQYSRDFPNEPTRLHLRTSLQQKRSSYIKRPATYNPWLFTLTGSSLQSPAQYGVTAGAFYLRDRTFAPNFKSFQELLKSPKKGGGYKAKLREVLLPHEKFIGPNVVMAAEGLFSAYSTEKERRSYYSFYTDFLYWKFYFSARSGSISMKFNPNIVAGFPCVIFDKFHSKNPVHFIGYVVSVNHQISQSGGVTQAQLISLRPSTELLDWDGGQTPLEDIIYGTSGAMYDDRYFPNKIGEEFYKPILGCGSIFDLETGLTGEAQSDAFHFTTQKAIKNINEKYVKLVEGKNDIHKFISNLTVRKGKANVFTVLGINPIGVDPNGSEGGFNKELPDKKIISAEQGGFSTFEEGFLESAIDPDHEEAKLTYKKAVRVPYNYVVPARTTTEWDLAGLATDPMLNLNHSTNPGGYESIEESLPTLIPGNEDAIGEALENAVIEYYDDGSGNIQGNEQKASTADYLLNKYAKNVRIPAKKKTAYRTVYEDASYGLDEKLKERQELVKKYVESLLYRGLRG